MTILSPNSNGLSKKIVNEAKISAKTFCNEKATARPKIPKPATRELTFTPIFDKNHINMITNINVLKKSLKKCKM